MKARVIKCFTDKTKPFRSFRDVGQEFECTNARFKELEKRGLVESAETQQLKQPVESSLSDDTNEAKPESMSEVVEAKEASEVSSNAEPGENVLETQDISTASTDDEAKPTSVTQTRKTTTKNTKPQAKTSTRAKATKTK